MSSQSYPPKRCLGSLSSIRVDVRLQTDTKAISAATVRAAVESAIDRSQLEAKQDGETSDGLMKVYVATITTASHAGSNQPAGFAYVINLQLLTTVSGQQACDLFCVYSNMSFGSSLPVDLASAIIESATSLAMQFCQTHHECKG